MMSEEVSLSDATLNQVLAEIGSTLVEVVIGRVDANATVTGVSIYDPFGPTLIIENSLVLGIGVTGDEPTLELARQVAERRGAALLLREPLTVGSSATVAIESTGVPIIGLARGVSWDQIVSAASIAIGRHFEDIGTLVDLRTLSDAGNLRELANSISSLISAPITIEDVNSNIVAFSADQDTGGQSRRAAVLEQRVPASYLQRLRTSGVFHRIYAAGGTHFVEAGEIYERSRVVVRVAAGELLLGSIWAVSDTPLDAAQDRLLLEASRLVAFHMLRDRLESDSIRRKRRRVLSALLAGGTSARAAAGEIGLAAKSYAVFGAQSIDSVNGDAADLVRVEHISRTFELHLLAQHPNAIAGVAGDTIYGILPVDSNHECERKYLSQVGDSFIARSATRSPVRISIGETVVDVADLGLSKADSDKVLRVIRSRPRRTFRIEEVQHDVLLSEMKDGWEETRRDLLGLVRQLESHDRENSTQLLHTLDVYFEDFGDIRNGAERLIIHPNTFRNRLKRIQELLRVDLQNPDDRFNLMLQLRLDRL